MAMLDTLFPSIPEKSLPPVHSTSTKPDAPYETFQLLSNRLVMKTPVVQDELSFEKPQPQQQEWESKAHSERIVGFMKSLLARYNTVNQVKIVRKLVHDCPHP